MDAIVIDNVTKHFRKTTLRRHHTTFKSEVVRWLRRERRRLPADIFIQSLNGVSLRVPQGMTLGIIGRNGAGKSTLLKIITGIYSPTSGTVEVNGRISALLDLGAGFHPDFSGRENILINGVILGMSRSEIRARMQTIIDFSELGDFIDEPVRTYSSGMYMRLAFSVATHVDPDILLIDEILAVGDEHFSRKSRAKMNEFKKAGKTILLVTHDLNTVQTWCDQAAWIDAGMVRARGAPSDVVRQYRDTMARGERQAIPGSEDAAASSLHRPQNSANASTTESPLIIERLRLTNQVNQEVAVVSPSDSLNVWVDFRTTREIEVAFFGITVSRADGENIFGTDTRLDEIVMPRPLPKLGIVGLKLEQLHLGDGDYTIEITAKAEGDVALDSRAASFAIRSGLPDTGVVRLPHKWIVECRVEEVLSQRQSATGS